MKNLFESIDAAHPMEIVGYCALLLLCYAALLFIVKLPPTPRDQDEN